MRLSPLDIRKQEFSRGLRGYEVEEVDAFLQMLSSQWEELLDDVRRKSEEIRELEGKLAHYEKVEEALQEALQTARETSKKSIENAEQKAALLIKEAEARADEIKRDAERDRHELKRETTKLSSRKSEIVTRLRAFLMSELELLASYEGDDPVGFIKLLPSNPQEIDRGSSGSEARPAASSRSIEEPEEVEAADAPDHAAADDSFDVDPAFEDFEDDIPADVTAADYAEQKRSWRDTARPDDTADVDEGGRRDEDVDEPSEDDGPGWTTQTFVSGASEGEQSGDRAQFADADAEDDESERVSTEEIEKIRRILSDLD